MIIFLIVVLARTIRYSMSFSEVLGSEEFKHFVYEGHFSIIIVYTLAIAFTVNFTRQMSWKMGQGVLFNFITGKYHEPREEERIFMFLDLTSSTTIAEKLGDIQYYNFLNDFFFDITKCILAARGEKYRYVGDQVVVTWDIKEGLKNANCIRTHFYIKDEMERLKEKYPHNYLIIKKL